MLEWLLFVCREGAEGGSFGGGKNQSASLAWGGADWYGSATLFVDGEAEGAVLGGGGGILGDDEFLVAEVHEAVVVEVLGAVGGEECVEGFEEVLGTDVDGELIAEVVVFVELEGAAIVGGVDNHDALDPIASRHVGDVE